MPRRARPSVVRTSGEKEPNISVRPCLLRRRFHQKLLCWYTGKKRHGKECFLWSQSSSSRPNSE